MRDAIHHNVEAGSGQLPLGQRINDLLLQAMVDNKPNVEEMACLIEEIIGYSPERGNLRGRIRELDEKYINRFEALVKVYNQEAGLAPAETEETIAWHEARVREALEAIDVVNAVHGIPTKKIIRMDAPEERNTFNAEGDWYRGSRTRSLTA